ncbi:Rec domain [Halorhabdus sp. SVX81]|uniref:response regulator transcription factor n=1 Tax=Halorhabdus sp. SVX81 TaxID=2978283 RepID=UPI0023DA91A7|nr:response regulator [Halorhabdus sp. SVX81]WEL18929.1 Rec domain [Halorhabdus sp. SVX81]
MSPTPESDTTVLVVEDERATAEGYARLLEADYDVRVAYDGEQALDALEETVDVVLLDRRIPGLSGVDVLDVIEDRGLDCRVALVTAVAPDYDILELGIDDYLTKPVGAKNLEATVEKLCALDEHERLQRELSSARVKRNVLEVEKDENELANSDEFARLIERIETLESRLTEIEDAYPAHFET